MALPAHDPLSAAGFPRRLAAFAIDAVLLAFATALLYVLFQATFGAPLDVFAEPWQWESFLFALATAPSAVYFALCESSRAQATLGKRVLHVRVVDVYGARIGTGRAFLRALVKLLPWAVAYIASGFPGPVLVARAPIHHPRLLFAAYGLWALYIAAAMMTLRKQSVHDLAAGTYVARV
jgi:uncharacterized RDD family membrane protein YckC